MPAWILGLVFVLVGSPMVALALWVFERDRRLATWPRVPGVITRSEATSHTTKVRDKNGYSYDTTMWRSVVRYTYTSGGTEREGTRISRQDPDSTSKDWAEKAIAPYPVGKSVDVMVDPHDPSVAYLETQRSIGAIILLGFGGLWIALGVLIAALSIFG